MGYEVVDFYVKDTSPLGKPVVGAIVKIFSEDGRLVFTQTETDVVGHAGFLLASGFRYQARFYKRNVSFTNPLFFDALTALGANVFDVKAGISMPPTPNDRRLCTAYGYFRTLTGAEASGVGIHFIARFRPLLLDGAGILTEREIVRTDQEGYAQVNLIRLGQYDVTLQGFEDYTHKITVPDAPNVNLPDLLFPVVAAVSFEPGPPFVIPVGVDVQVTPTVVATDGEVLWGPAMDDVLWRSSDSNVLAVLPVGPKVTLRGLARGTANILVSRANYSIIRYPDLPIAGQPTPVVVA